MLLVTIVIPLPFSGDCDRNIDKFSEWVADYGPTNVNSSLDIHLDVTIHWTGFVISDESKTSPIEVAIEYKTEGANRWNVLNADLEQENWIIELNEKVKVSGQDALLVTDIRFTVLKLDGDEPFTSDLSIYGCPYKGMCVNEI